MSTNSGFSVNSMPYCCTTEELESLGPIPKVPNSRKKWICLDCLQDTGRMNEHYFVHTDIWLSVTKSISGMLCIGCLENRLGRKLNHLDFPEVTINNPKHGNKSLRLLERLGKL